MELSTKANNLRALSGRLQHGEVLDCFVITVAEFHNDPKEIIDRISKRFNANLIVRSSALDEDSLSASRAGCYDTVTNVDYKSPQDISAAIEKVIQSYPNNAQNYQVLIQEMLTDVDACGVLFTVDQDTLAPYYVLNYSEDKSTSSLTSGQSKSDRVFVYARRSENWLEKWHNHLISLAQELQWLYMNDKLDIEFAVSGEKVFLLQVRPIITVGKDALEHVDLDHVLRGLTKKIEKLDRPSPLMVGKSFVLGLMPDWNPAEMLGVRPTRLATSLYQELITNSVWAKQRAKYGYRDLEGCPLLVTLLQVPYVDVRASFNSFIPASLPENLASKLVDFYLEKLKAHPQLHDKVEFEVVISCYDFDLARRFKELKKSGFTAKEIDTLERSLHALTLNILDPNGSEFWEDKKNAFLLQKKRDAILNSELSDIDKIYHLVGACKKYGTLPFSGAARCAFISIQILRSMRENGDLSPTEYDSFMESINTVSKEMARDSAALCDADWLKKYGHLRPGTYDITNLAYRDFTGVLNEDRSATVTKIKEYILSKGARARILSRFKKHDFNVDVDLVFDFFRESIEARERIKFEFSRVIDDVFVLILKFVSRYGISREEAAFLDIGSILRFRNELSPLNVHSKLLSEISENRVSHRIGAAIRLPYLISNKNDVFGFELIDELPNYVTRKSVTALIALASGDASINLAGKVAVIEAADPGYDYIFSQDIAGLITCFGGSNSHMAIRCAELGIPGAIGVGNKLYKQLLTAKSVFLDAANQKLDIF